MTPVRSGSRIRRWRAWLLGLRPRLVVVLLLVAAGSGLATAGVGYATARNALLEGSQDQVMNEFLDQVQEIARETPRLDEDAAAEFQTGLRGEVAVFYREGDTMRDVFDASTWMKVPARLMDAVGQGERVHFQRVVQDGSPYLYVGTAIQVNGVPTGLEVFQRFSQGGTQRSLDQLERGAVGALAVAGFAALVLALLAARSVLRPVRELNRGARRLGAGALSTRLPVRGSDELSQLVMSFNSAAEQLERSVEQLRREEQNSRRFVGDVSHELRTPLAAMVAVTETLDGEAARLGDDGAAAARVLSAETHRLAELVENLIEISRFDARQATLVLEEVDLTEVIRGALRARGWLDQVDVYTVPGPSQRSVTLAADPRRLDVIVANLAGNALTHGEGPVTVTVFHHEDDDGWAGVAVRDSGPGMEAEVAAHVFERFYKADQARSRSEGSGLGLAIAWENAQLHGGRITMTTAPGEGTTFTLLLPGTVTSRIGDHR